MTKKIFFDRRSGMDRRSGKEQRENPRLDLPHRQRRSQQDRRTPRTLVEDYYAFHDAHESAPEPGPETRARQASKTDSRQAPDKT